MITHLRAASAILCGLMLSSFGFGTLLPLLAARDQPKVTASSPGECGQFTFAKLSPNSLSLEIQEMSGLTLSGTEADTLVHVQDSGNDPVLTYTKRDGSILASYRYGDKNSDSEELARGECPWGGACIFVFDTGDNFHWRSQRSIWAVDEATLKTDKIRSEKIDFKFPGEEKADVEAAVVIGKTIYLFVKEPKHSRVFALSTGVWKGENAEAKLITDLPYTMVTGAAASTDGSRILLLNWQGVVEMTKAGTGSKSADGWFPYRRRIKIKSLAQQEAITFDHDQKSFLYSSEKKLFSNREWGIMQATCTP